MTIEQVFQEGITCFQAGLKEDAAKLFAQVVKTDPNSDQGWFM
jgi:hypothetical protein